MYIQNSARVMSTLKSKATTSTSSRSLSDEQLRTMPAPKRVNKLQWDLSTSQERRGLLTARADVVPTDVQALSSGLSASVLDQIIARQAIPLQASSSAAVTAVQADAVSGAQTPTEQAALDTVTRQFQQQFAGSAQNKAAFHQLMQKAFGATYNETKAEAIRQQTLKGDFSWMPTIKLVDAGQLTDVSQTRAGQGSGAYSTSKDTVYLSRDLLNTNPAAAGKILAEEVGHAIDAKVNVNDAKGDEGDIFSRLVRGESISDTRLAELKREDDSGSIEVDGEKIDIEFGFFKKLKKKFKKKFRKIKNSVKKAFKKIGSVIMSPLEKVKEVFKKIMESELLAKVMMAARFIPIPIVQVIVRVYNIAKAVYSVYQGIKNGSVGAILGGVASAAGGMGKFAGAAGLSGFAAKAASVARYAGTASRAYRVVAEKNFAAAAGLASDYFGSDNAISNFITTAGKANTVYRAVKNDDYLSVVGAGSSLVKNFTGTEGDLLLQKIGNNADTLNTVKKAVGNGDYSAAALLLSKRYGGDVGLSGAQRQKVDKTIDTYQQLQQARNLIDSKNYAQASQILIKTAQDNLDNPQLSQQFDKAGKVIEQVDKTIKAVRDGNYAKAIMHSNIALSNPLNKQTQRLLTDVQTFATSVRRIGKQIDAKDFGAAGQGVRDLVSFMGDKSDVMEVLDNTAVSVESFVYQQIAGRATSVYADVRELFGGEKVNVKFSDKNFSAWTGGLSVQQVQNAYRDETGQIIDRETIIKLFTDPQESQKILLNNAELHTTFREILNRRVPASIDRAQDSGEWKELSQGESVFHGSLTRGNRKFISKDGHREVVFDKNGDLVTNAAFKGTFNFFAPTVYPVAHIQADVDPYVKYGN